MKPHPFHASKPDPHPDLWAKSESEAGVAPISLYTHLKHVADLAQLIAQQKGFDPDTARLGGLFHDIGKAHPLFQKRLQGKKDLITYRHEYTSLMFLPLVPENRWEEVVDMIAAHHKPVYYDPAEKGFLDMFVHNNFDNSFDAHADYGTPGSENQITFEMWQGKALEVLDALGVETREITRTEAKETLIKIISHIEKRLKIPGPSRWRGLLMAADHMTSALEAEKGAFPNALFISPGFAELQQRPTSHLYPLSARPFDDPRPHTLVTAPTGAGKTDYLLKRCRGRVFYVLPYQASINAMYGRLRASPYFPDTDVRLLHAASQLVEEQNTKQESALEERILQPFVGASVKVLTPHQLAAIIFATPGYEAAVLDVEGADVILDEIHTYDQHAQAMVLALVRTLVYLGCRLHIGTATMPTVLYEKLRNLLGGPEQVCEMRLTDEELDTYNRHEVHKLRDEAERIPLIKEAISRGEKVLVVFNTVKAAQEFFGELQKALPDDLPRMLIHSRFRRRDRNRLEHQLTEEMNMHEGPCVVVSTQVVEVSLDISFDRMITEAAPIDALIQRFGRINRRRTEATLGTLRPVHVMLPGTQVLPYSREVIERSFEALPDGAVLPERELQRMLDAVYPEINEKSIDSHLVYRKNKWRINQLLNSRKSVLLEALEIDAATCILEKDRAVYESPDVPRSSKQQLEIPVNGKTMYHQYRHDFEQLPWGTRPYVIPDRLGPSHEESYNDIIGLQLQKPDNFY